MCTSPPQVVRHEESVLDLRIVRYVLFRTGHGRRTVPNHTVARSDLGPRHRNAVREWRFRLSASNPSVFRLHRSAPHGVNQIAKSSASPAVVLFWTATYWPVRVASRHINIATLWCRHVNTPAPPLQNFSHSDIALAHFSATSRGSLATHPDARSRAHSCSHSGSFRLAYAR